MNLLPPTASVSIDLAHAILLMGVIASAKPGQVIELGFGGGYATDAILQALEWNRTGTLTVVDNWFDWQMVEPVGLTQSFRERGADFITSDEESFVKSCPDRCCDILISDADHFRSHLWLQDHLRIVRPGGVLFFHDVGRSTLFGNLRAIPENLSAMGIPFMLFEANSRSEESCSRGWLMASKPQISSEALGEPIEAAGVHLASK